MPKKSSCKAKPKDPYVEFVRFQSDSLRTARELCYSNEILQIIRDAKTEGEIIRALAKGRNQMK